MSAPRRALVCIAAFAVLGGCAPTTIVGDLTTSSSVASDATTTTLPEPTGSVPELLQQLADLTVGLGDAIVDGDNATGRERLARAEAIGAVLVEKIRLAGIDLVEDVQRIVGLIRTAVERRRPADADKAQRFAALIKDAAITLFP